MENIKDDSFVRAVQEELKTLGTLLVEKNRAYGDSIASEPLFAKGVNTETAIMVRANDKIKRLDNLLKNGGTENDETIDDTIRDLAGYCILWLINRLN